MPILCHKGEGGGKSGGKTKGGPYGSSLGSPPKSDGVYSMSALPMGAETIDGEPFDQSPFFFFVAGGFIALWQRLLRLFPEHVASF